MKRLPIFLVLHVLASSNAECMKFEEFAGRELYWTSFTVSSALELTFYPFAGRELYIGLRLQSVLHFS
jgi:hypothetical protein